MEGTSIHNAYTPKGNDITKHSAYTALVRRIFGYGAVCWDRTERQVRALNGVQQRAAKFANNINVLGWETLAQRRCIAQISAFFTA